MDYSILRYGAVADGVTNCAAAIQQAVDAAAAAGGGRVIVPAGRFLSGSVLLKDNVELHLESGAVLISSLNPADITPFPQGGDGTDPDDTADGWEGGFFLGASHAKNVTISGMGTIYGQGDKVFLDKDVDNGFHECPKFCEAFRPRMMLFEAVENFTVRDVTLKDAAFWTLHMAGCQNVRIDGIKILNDDRGANNDGIPATSPHGLTVKNCFIRTTDDCISLKTENKDIDADVAIEGSTMYGVASSDGVMVGYECKGRLTNVKVKDCDIIGGRGTTILGYGHAGFTIGCDGPGPIENVTFENVRVENKVFENNMLAIVTDGKAYMPNTSPFHGKPGSIKGITLKNVSWENAGMPMRFVGHGADNTIKDILFENCTAGGNLIDGTDTYFMTKISPNLNEFVSPSEIRVRNR